MSFMWDIGIPTASNIDGDGFIGVQVDGNGTNAPHSMGEAHWPFGSYSRPLDPTPAQAKHLNYPLSGTALYALEGGQLHVWPLFDARYAKTLPALSKGGSGIFGGPPATPGYAIFDGATGNWKLRSPAVSIGSDAAQTLVFAPILDNYLGQLESLVQSLADVIDAKLPSSAGAVTASTHAVLSALSSLRATFATTITKAA